MLRIERHPQSQAASIDTYHLHHITGLTVHRATGVVDLIPPRLITFPSLKTLVVDIYQNPELDSELQKASFVKLIHESCPTLTTISFGHAYSSVAKWLTTNDGSLKSGFVKVRGVIQNCRNFRRVAWIYSSYQTVTLLLVYLDYIKTRAHPVLVDAKEASRMSEYLAPRSSIATFNKFQNIDGNLRRASSFSKVIF
jgi:hypothetical protein